jgi:hypothetical protein
MISRVQKPWFQSGKSSITRRFSLKLPDELPSKRTAQLAGGDHMQNPNRCHVLPAVISLHCYPHGGRDRTPGLCAWNMRVGFSFARTILAAAPLLLAGLGMRATAEPQPASAPASAKRFVRQALHQNRLSFVPNSGQEASTTRFAASGPGFRLSLEKDSMTLLAFHEAPAPAGSSHPVAGAQGGGLWNLPPGPSRSLPAVSAQLTRLRFLGANPDVRIEGREPSEAKVNLLIGNDPAKWQRNLVTYSSVRYANLYPGVDLFYYGEKNGQLEYDLVVAPGADPGVVRLKVDGSRDALLDENGDLRLDGKNGDAVLRRPMLYQDIANGKRAIAGSFVQIARNEFGFKPAQYDHTRPLVIDPTFSLLYSTFMGGIHEDAAGTIALDAQNNVYITGITASQDFPVSANAFLNQLVKPYEYELNTFVMKFDSSGTLLFSTYLGGSGQNGALSDQGHPGDEPAARNVGIDGAGNVYVAGTTTSTDFPVTANAYQPTNMGTQNGYLAELSPDGSTLEYGSYFGGSALLLASSMARAANGQIYVAGSAGPGLPTTAGAYKTTLATPPAGQGAPYEAAFLSVFDITQGGGKQLVGSTYYGTDTPQANTVLTGNLGYTMALDGSGDPWLVGQAYTNNLPTTANAYQPSIPALTTYCGNAGGPLNSAGYIAEFNPSLTTLQYASYLSGKNSSVNAGNSCSEYTNGLAIDSSNNIYVDGATGSGTFPVTTGALQTTIPALNSYSEFIAKLNPGGATINWATYLGGAAGSTFSGDLTPDAQGNVWAVGITAGGSTFPITSDAYQTTGPGSGNYAGFIDEISPDGAKLVYGTYFGGDANTTPLDVAVDANENVYVTGSTTNTAFPVTANALQPLFANGDQGPDNSDAFFSILGGGTIGVISPIVGGDVGDTTITVEGAGFQQGATCSIISGDTTIASTIATVNSSGTAVTCTFPLNGAPTGSYTVIVTNPDGSALTKQSAFTVESAVGPQMNLSIVGRPAIRVSVATTFDLVVSNMGDTNAYGSMVAVAYPPNLTTGFQLAPFPQVGAPTNYNGVSNIYEQNGVDKQVLFIPVLAPGQSVSYTFQVTDGVLNDSPTIIAQLAVGATSLDTSDAGPDLSGNQIEGVTPKPRSAIKPIECFQHVVSSFANAFGVPGCLGGSTVDILISACMGQAPNIPEPNGGANFAQWMAAQIAQNCAGAVNPVAGAAASAFNAWQVLGDCGGQEIQHSIIKFFTTGSIDPNYKGGSAGDGSSSKYTNGSQPLPYIVGFENEPSATAPAAAVVVTDQLDPAKVDLSTFSLGPVSIGSNVITPPLGVNSFATTFAPPNVTS